MDSMNLEKEDGVTAYLLNCGRIVDSSQSIILFGSAKCAEKVYKFIKDRGAWGKVQFVLDNDTLKSGKLFHGKCIYSPNDSPGNLQKCAIIIASGSAHIIKKQLEGMGIKGDSLFEFPFTNLQLSPTPFEEIKHNEREIKKTYDMLEDQRSKQVYEALLNYKITRRAYYLQDVFDREEDQYFDNTLVELSDNDVVVDCGAYIGDTLQEYCKRVNGRIKKYVCFEADTDVCKKLKNNIDIWGIENVDVYNIGCWNKKDNLRLNVQGSGTSFLTESKDGEVIEVDALDNILRDLPVSFVKMDIEGAEEKALLGMKHIISKYKPILAISIYHSIRDFWYLPQLIKQLMPDYMLYIRHYRQLSDSETICYAVPNPNTPPEARDLE